MKFFKIVLLVVLFCAFGCEPNHSNKTYRPDEASFEMYNCTLDELKTIDFEVNLCYKYTSKTGRQCLKDALMSHCKPK